MTYETRTGIHTPSGSGWSTIVADGYTLHVDRSDGEAPNLADSVARTLSETPVEVGSGSSAKTRRLLETWLARGETRYVPIDISRTAIEQAASDEALKALIEGWCGAIAESPNGLAEVDRLRARLLEMLVLPR